MKVYEKEISANGKRRLLIALNRQELRLLYGVVKKAYLHTPQITETDITLTRLQNMRKSMGKFLNEINKPVLDDVTDEETGIEHTF